MASVRSSGRCPCPPPSPRSWRERRRSRPPRPQSAGRRNPKAGRTENARRRKTPVEGKTLVEGHALPHGHRRVGPPVRLLDRRGERDIRSQARHAHARAVRYLRPEGGREVKALRMDRSENGRAWRLGPQLGIGRADLVPPLGLECKPEGKPSNERRDPCRDQAHPDVNQEIPRPLARSPWPGGQPAHRVPRIQPQKTEHCGKNRPEAVLLAAGARPGQAWPCRQPRAARRFTPDLGRSTPSDLDGRTASAKAARGYVTPARPGHRRRSQHSAVGDGHQGGCPGRLSSRNTCVRRRSCCWRNIMRARRAAISTGR